MNLATLFQTALQSFARSKMRAALTALSVAIGVALVVTVVAISTGGREAVAKAAESMGTNVFNVWPSGGGYGGVRSAAGTEATLTLDDVRAIREEIDLVTGASGQIRQGGLQCVNGNRNWNTTVMGVEVDYVDVRSWPVAEGRMFTQLDVEQAQRVCILGERVASELFSIQAASEEAEAPRNGAPVARAATIARESPLGVEIRIRGIPFRVLGVLAAKGQNAMGWDQDDVVLAPISTVLRRLGGKLASNAPNAVGSVSVAAVDADAVEPAMAAVKELLARRHRSAPGAEDFTVRNFSDMAQAAAQQQRILAYLLASVALISLVVGGIGIMNIMLVSVTERTREIGLRLAVGAKPENILAQFLTEALLISMAGGVVGLAMAVVSTWAISQALGWATPISGLATAGAMTLSILIGGFFGFYPAQKAARLDPIESLRYE